MNRWQLGGRLFASRRVLSMLVVWSFVSLLVSACAETTRYRVLNFFFDGVPQPGESSADEGIEGATAAAATQEPAGTARPAIEKPKVYYHTPYREKRCAGCHDMYRGQLVQPVEGGLCLSCHTDPPGEASYVHGPVAVNACMQCHHYHSSPYAGILLEGPETLCFSCHDLDELTEGRHHAAIESAEGGSCIECHDPHGGSDRYFLK